MTWFQLCGLLWAVILVAYTLRPVRAVLQRLVCECGYYFAEDGYIPVMPWEELEGVWYLQCALCSKRYVKRDAMGHFPSPNKRARVLGL
jgi:hypothetical protein